MSEVVLVVDVNGESEHSLGGSNLSEDEADGRLADPALEVPESNNHAYTPLV